MNSYESILTTLSKLGGGEIEKYFSLPALDDLRIDRLPYSIRIPLKSAISNCDGFQVMEKDVEKILDWENTAPSKSRSLLNWPKSYFRISLVFQRPIVVPSSNGFWRHPGLDRFAISHPLQRGDTVAGLKTES